MSIRAWLCGWGRHGLAAALGIVMFSPIAATARLSAQRSVVKIYSTMQVPDYEIPWQVSNPGGATGSGFIIEKRRILTNAHVVSNTRFLEVQKEGDPRRFLATIAFIAHDCDLAILEVRDPEFFKGTHPLSIGDVLPSLDDQVVVVGYPMGGARISVTHGVISRIDYSQYSHSGVDQHLVLQVDAAINPGNSGGPVMYKGKVVGVAFQVLTVGQNIGYAIPIPVIKHFLDDVADGTYNGYPELGVGYMDLRNPALRKDLRLPENRTGVAIYHVDPFGSAVGLLAPRDVVLSIDNHRVANDGTIVLDGNTVEFMEMLERKQWGDSISMTVWRTNAEMRLTIPLKNPYDPFTFRHLYDRTPQYLIAGGLVFSPLTSEYLRALGSELSGAANQHLLYYSQYAKIDGLYKGRDEFVVLISRLAHPVNTYCDAFLNAIVAEVNGQRIRNLKEMKTALDHPQNGFHVIRFEGESDTLVMQADAASKANAEVLAAYGVPAPEHIEDSP